MKDIISAANRYKLNKSFNEIRNNKDDPNYLIFIILFYEKTNYKLLNKIILDKFNYLIFLI